MLTTRIAGALAAALLAALPAGTTVAGGGFGPSATIGGFGPRAGISNTGAGLYRPGGVLRRTPTAGYTARLPSGTDRRSPESATESYRRAFDRNILEPGYRDRPDLMRYLRDPLRDRRWWRIGRPGDVPRTLHHAYREHAFGLPAPGCRSFGPQRSSDRVGFGGC